MPQRPSEFFQDRLRSARDNLRRMTQAELARAVGLPPSSIAHFESGNRKPSFDNLRKLANALNVTTDYLVGRADSPRAAGSSDSLYRHVANLTEENRRTAEGFLRYLAEQDRKQRIGTSMDKLSDFRRRSLVRQAERLLQEENLLELPVDLEALAKTRNIYIREMDSTEKGVSGMLLRHGDTFGILYSTRIWNIGFQRFSVAHELGHYFIDGHLDHISFDGGKHRSRAGFVSNDNYEREADHFAAGLLMPIAPVRRVIYGAPAGLGGVEAVKQRANTSLTAAAIRYAGLTDAAAAIVVSSKDKVDYCFMSERMKSLPGIDWPRKGMMVPSETVTESVLNSLEGERPEARADGEVEIATWLGGQGSVVAREEVIGLGNYGRVLTVLTCPDLVDESYVEEQDSDEALMESWTPKFRR